MPFELPNFDDLPGAHLIREGLSDLALSRRSSAAFLVQIGSPKLNRCGLTVEVTADDALAADHGLYQLLASDYGNDAHGRYNALLRELVSFERALEMRTAQAVRHAAMV
ncbi:MAG: hypothetical protein NTV80_25065 [Verrucomicrobia bacterium]|nr:hypothetical protein [Verrucomicrobiota bacterium]